MGDRTARDSGGLTVPTFMGNKRMNLAPRLLKQAGSFGIPNPWLSDHPPTPPSTRFLCYHIRSRGDIPAGGEVGG